MGGIGEALITGVVAAGKAAVGAAPATAGATTAVKTGVAIGKGVSALATIGTAAGGISGIVEASKRRGGGSSPNSPLRAQLRAPDQLRREQQRRQRAAIASQRVGTQLGAATTQTVQKTLLGQ